MAEISLKRCTSLKQATNETTDHLDVFCDAFKYGSHFNMLILKLHRNIINLLYPLIYLATTLSKLPLLHCTLYTCTNKKSLELSALISLIFIFQHKLLTDLQNKLHVNATFSEAVSYLQILKKAIDFDLCKLICPKAIF